MWILESSSELFQGRRMWLKPGKSYLFGRVKKDGVRFAIEHKTISRKHFVIKVEDVNLEEVGNINVRTRITIEDQNSKAGTTVNGEFTKGSIKELKREENYIKPGSLPEDLVIKWHPYVLTYNLLKKEIKAGVLKAKQERIKDLDIKVVSEYLVGKTSHLVVNKRNTPKSLQALIDGKPLVAESYIDSLEYAATPSDLNEEENLSPLEQDFDSAWPEAFDHLPPPGREPTSRPPETYQPDNKRRTIFEDFTFVFIDQNQYDNLLASITTGHGKALLCKVVVGETETIELVTFLQNAAGRKDFGTVRKDTGKGGIILVRYKGDTGAEDWTNHLINEVSLRLDQRAIDQGEFLDAILANDATLLRQAVPFETHHDSLAVPPASSSALAPLPQSVRAEVNPVDPRNGHGAQASSLRQRSQATQPTQKGNSSPRTSVVTSQPVDTTQVQPDSVEDNSQPVVRRPLVIPKKIKVIDFDDDFDPNSIIPYEEDEEVENIAQTPQSENESDVVKDEPVSARKRPRSATNEGARQAGDVMDDLLPGAALMKRRKIVIEGQNQPRKGTTINTIPTLLRRPKPEKEIDVRKIAKARRQAEDDRLKKEQEYEEDDIHLEPGQSLPIYDVETVLIELPTRNRTHQEAEGVESDRWDPRWNGRKNFKAFRRAKDAISGTTATGERRRNLAKVIVPMVDAKTSTYGMGDQYWDKSEQEKERDRERRKKQSQKTTQSQSDQSRASHRNQSETINISDEEDEHVSTNGNGNQTSLEISRLQHEAEEIMNHTIDVDEPRLTRASDTQSTTVQSSRGPKRPANGVGRGGNTKRQKTVPVTIIARSDSDDSDDMKFKFGSRRRGRGRT